MAKTDKTDKKIKKCDKKTGKKCEAIALLLSACCLLHGCSQTGSQPSRSQTMNNDFNRCVVVIASKATVSNDCMVAEGDGIQPNEIFTQTMKNEGSESNSPTATPTLDIKPQTTLNYGLTSSTPAGAKWIDALDGYCAKLLSSWLGSGKANGTMEVTKKDGTKEIVTCKDGVCTTASGECITCKPSSSGSTCSDCQIK